ncbi:MAG: hypothetical protein K6A90_12945 [Lachnospiraceae bacterium]|nr:hypothetical protein [Lachnospiraceae bacterium]
MKKKLLTVLLAGVLTMSMITACGGSKAADSSADAAKTEEKAEDTEEEEVEEEADAEEADAEEEDVEEADVEEADSEDAGDGSFSLMDVTEDMIQTGVYGMSEDGEELVFTLFNGPDGTAYAALIGVDNNDTSNSDLICGEYETESFTDDDGIDWTQLTVTDVYTGGTYNLGFAEKDGEVLFFNAAGDVVEGKYLDASETINYFGSAIAVAQ